MPARSAKKVYRKPRATSRKPKGARKPRAKSRKPKTTRKPRATSRKPKGARKPRTKKIVHRRKGLRKSKTTRKPRATSRKPKTTRKPRVKKIVRRTKSPAKRDKVVSEKQWIKMAKKILLAKKDLRPGKKLTVLTGLPEKWPRPAKENWLVVSVKSTGAVIKPTGDEKFSVRFDRSGLVRTARSDHYAVLSKNRGKLPKVQMS